MERTRLEKLVDQSGFLFQMAVEEHVRATARAHGWKIVAHEYPWSSASAERGGFIDLIVGRQTLHAVIECKRTQAGEWVFLAGRDATSTLNLRTLWACRVKERGFKHGWDDLRFAPPDLESEFCVVRGSSDDQNPMLERIAGDLVRASESLVRERSSQPDRFGLAMFIPLIITNAKLFACFVDPAEVNLSTGFVPPSARFEEVGSVRFRKATASDIGHYPDTYSSIPEGLEKRIRSVVVINVDHLSTWLEKFNENGDMLELPWADLIRLD